jgi:hypothetical protein
MPLQATAQDEKQHVRGKCAGNGPEGENAERKQHNLAAPIDVGEFAEQRRRDGRHQQVRRYQPGQILEIVEVTPNRRERGCNDGLIERGHKHREADAQHNRPNLGIREHPTAGQRPARRRSGAG